MINFAPGVELSGPSLGRVSNGFTELTTSLAFPDQRGTILVEMRVSDAPVSVEWLYPFSWDSADRGVVTATRALASGERVCLHAGPYGTADACAHRDGVAMEFPRAGDRERYRDDQLLPPQPGEEHQDAAAWVLIAAVGRCVVLAWEYSAHLVTVVEADAAGAIVSVLLPADTFAPADAADVRQTPGPVGWLAVVAGGLDDGAAALRAFVAAEMITAPDLSGMPGTPEFPCLVANSWGVQEDTSTERIVEMMDAAAAKCAEVFVVDKGWERFVGDWHENERFGAGLGWLSGQARERGMGFGIWCGWGNADPRSPVAQEHPDWLATWRGQTPVLSFDNHALCLGHDPARDWALAELTRMVGEFKLTWMLHDFETIARCDSAAHSHDPGAGEHAAEAAWHHILASLAERFPTLVLENCWNGGRPLDLAMVRRHHTTITEDHCRTHANTLAKVGLGRYLPLDWQSAYMGADDLSPRARIAPYVIGGPWVLMDDPQTWSAETQWALGRASEVFRAWRGALRTATVRNPAPGLDAIQATAGDGRIMVAVSPPAGATSVELDLSGGGLYLVVDEWTGAESKLALGDGPTVFDVDPPGDGLLLSLTPTTP